MEAIPLPVGCELAHAVAERLKVGHRSSMAWSAYAGEHGWELTYVSARSAGIVHFHD
jgi:hypothetical protein